MGATSHVSLCRQYRATRNHRVFAVFVIQGPGGPLTECGPRSGWPFGKAHHPGVRSDSVVGVAGQSLSGALMGSLDAFIGYLQRAISMEGVGSSVGRCAAMRLCEAKANAATWSPDTCFTNCDAPCRLRMLTFVVRLCPQL